MPKPCGCTISHRRRGPSARTGGSSSTRKRSLGVSSRRARPGSTHRSDGSASTPPDPTSRNGPRSSAAQQRRKLGAREMTRPPHNAVVVGFDGSTGSTDALDWGAREADRRGLRLHVVHVWQPPPMLSAGFGTPTMPDSEAILVDAAMRVGNVAPQLTVSTQAVPAPVAGAFIEASFDAATIVIGAHGYRRVGIRDYGSTAWQVAIH